MCHVHGLLYHKIYKPIVLNYKNLLKLQLKWLDIIGDSKVVQKKDSAIKIQYDHWEYFIQSDGYK